MERVMASRHGADRSERDPQLLRPREHRQIGRQARPARAVLLPDRKGSDCRVGLTEGNPGRQDSIALHLRAVPRYRGWSMAMGVTCSGETDRSQVRDLCGNAAFGGAAESAGNAQSVSLHFVLQNDQVDVRTEPFVQFPSLARSYSSLDDNSIRSSIFKATSGFLNFAKAGVKGILGDEDRSVVVQIVDELVNGRCVYSCSSSFLSHRSSSLTESFGYYDPATGRTIMPSDGGKMSFEDVIVFMVGGGNYSEYQHLQMYAKSQNPARVILYGSTDICPANQVGLGIASSWW